MQNIWLTADTHFNHANILRYDKRPFESIRDHDDNLIANWNSVVKSNDIVYHLGDIHFGNPLNGARILNQLNGKIHLIIGNHDVKYYKKYPLESAQYYLRLKHGKKELILCHYPMYSWHGKSRGAFMIHGHTHGNHHDDFEHPTKINVGTNLWGYFPVNIDVFTKEDK